jgi:hypothetical protein
MCRRFGLAQLLMAIAAIAVCFGAIRGGIAIVESGRRQVHPSEQEIADHIRDLGGTYRKERWHIIVVWLPDTPTTDADMKLIMSLPGLLHLDIQGTQVTDESLDVIFAHPRLKTVKVTGTRISRARLVAAWEASDRVDVEE